MTEFLQQHHMLGLAIGLCTFLAIGLFHPLVIKGYYYFGLRCRVWFLVFGLLSAAAATMVADIFWQAMLGVVAFSSFWSIKEIADQAERVRKGWFPPNPKKPDQVALARQSRQ